MAIEISPEEYQDVPVADVADMVAEEESEETQAEEEAEHRLPAELRRILESENILEDLDDADIVDVRTRVTDGYDMDYKSMDDYVEKYTEIIQLASMDDDKSGDKTFPFVGASKVMLPQLAKAAIDFNSRTAPELINRADVANVKVWGRSDVMKEAKAERRALAVNWQLKKGIDGWARRMDRALLLLPVGGMFFKKKWWQDGAIQDCLITADRMVYDHDADSFDEAPRKSHWFMIEQNEFESRVRSGYYCEIEEHKKTDDKNKQPTVEKPLKLIESHCTLDLDKDGYCEPYIVTFCDCCDTVVKIEKRFSEDDVIVDDGQVVSIEGEEFFTQHGFIPDLKKPAVYVGWGQLMYDMFKALNTMTRQMIDAGTLNNTAMNSGFISNNIKAPGRSKKGRVELILGQLSPVDVGAGQSLKDMIWTPQFQGVSQSFYQMMTDLKAEVDSYVTASQTMDVTAGEAASLYLARLIQALKVPNAIMSRVYGSLTDEFNRIDDLMRRYMPDAEYRAIINWEPEVPDEVMAQYQQAVQMSQQMGMPPPPDPVEVANSMVTKESDFAESFDILTTADPSMGSDQERIARAEIIAMRAADVPGYNRYECEKNYLEKMGEVNIDTLLPKPNNEPDPMQVLQMEWTKADIEKMKVDSAVKAGEMDIKMKKLEDEIQKLVSETMKNLAEVDAKEAATGMQVLEHARADVQLEMDAQGQLTQRQAYKVMDHPEIGEVTEADIQRTMEEEGMSRDEVLAQLQGMGNE